MTVSLECQWGVIDTHKKTRTGYESKQEAVDYYMKNCSDGKNCWGILLNRPKEFWK